MFDVSDILIDHTANKIKDKLLNDYDLGTVQIINLHMLTDFSKSL